VIVAPVSLDDPGFRKRAAGFAGYGRDGVHQRVELGDIVAVGASLDCCERGALRFGDEVVL